jgi:hypothetical protein
MRLPIIKGTIKRRLLVNFRADPDAVRRILPQPFYPKLHGGQSLVGICLIRLEQIRPSGFPRVLGLSSENAAHRIAVEWVEPGGRERDGVYIPRRDTGSVLNRLAGGRVFPGEHHRARFTVLDEAGHIEFSMWSLDDAVSVKVVGDESNVWPASSCFGSLAEASEFFEQGSLGYSATRKGDRFDGLLLQTADWRVRPLAVAEVQSSFFDDRERFPEGSIEFDHALVMRDLRHEWHTADDLYAV